MKSKCQPKETSLQAPKRKAGVANKVKYISLCIYLTYFKGGRIKTWKKRYMVLKDNCLYYFKKPDVKK